MKKLTVFLLALALAAGSLAGCAKNSGTAPSAAGASKSEAEPQSSQLTEIIWFSLVDTKMTDEQAVFDKLNELLKDKINVKVIQNLMTASDYIEKMPVKIASGEKFDICFMAEWAANYLNNVNQGACLELDGLLQEQGKATYDFLPEMLWKAASVNGKIYGIPTYKELGTQYGFLINQDLADQYGVDVSGVSSYEDMEAVLAKVKEKATPDIIGVCGTTFNSAKTWESVVSGQILPGAYKVDGFKDFQDQPGLFNQYDTQEFKDYCALASKWFKAGYLPGDPVQYDKDSSGRERDDKAGKLFSLLIGYAPSYEVTRAAQMGHAVTYHPIMNPVFTTGSAMGGLQTISANSEHPQEAMAFLNLVNTDKEVGTLLRHGIEGTHYSKVSDTRLDATMSGALSTENHPYNYPFAWQFGSPLNQVWDISYPDSVEESFTIFNKAAKAAQHVGFSFNVENVSTQAASLQSTVDQYLQPLQTGMVDPSQIPVFLDALQKAGVEAYMNEAKTQVEAWKSVNK